MSELNYKRTTVYNAADEAEIKAIADYSEGYKSFLDKSKKMIDVTNKMTPMERFDIPLANSFLPLCNSAWHARAKDLLSSCEQPA